MKNKLTYVGILFILIFIIVAVFAPCIAPYNPNTIFLSEELNPPSRRHLLGQDKLGRDILSRIVYGSRVSLSMGIIVVGISVLVGCLSGAISGYLGGVIDIIFMRIVDIVLAFPGILLAIAMISLLGPSFYNIAFALCIVCWVGYARITRAQVMSLKERDFVAASKLTGKSTIRIVLSDILPNALSPIIVEATFGVAGVILADSSLSFLGLGPQDVPTWGGMLNTGVDFLLFAPHCSIFPGIAIMLSVLAINFIGDGIRDLLDVRI